MSILTDFKQAQLNIRRNRKVIVSHAQRLELTGLFRQAELGDNLEQPPKQDNIISYQKWVEHSKHKGLSKEDAMKRYIEIVASILQKKVAATPKLPPFSYHTRPTLSSFRIKSVKMKKSTPVPPMSPPIKKPSNQKEVNKTLSLDKKNIANQMKEQLVPAESLPSILESKQSRLRRMETGPKPQKQKKTEKTKVGTLKGKSTLSEVSLLQVEDKPVVPPLPPMHKVTVGKQDEVSRAELFKSKRFSSMLGTQNPLNEHEDLQKKFMLYEKLRTFMAIHDPERIKRGLGALVEWGLTHGEVNLNKNLKTKYKTDLNDLEKNVTKKVAEKRKVQKRLTRQQLALSQRLMHTKDVTTKKKMDKLTRFLLVNDPELVAHGMFLMTKFIETKGLGALNENLKKNYGKSLDSVTDEELNTELKKRYGKDLGMLDKPMFSKTSRESMASTETTDDGTLEEQILNIDKEKLKSRQQEATRPSVSSPSQKQSNVRSIETSFDTAAYRTTFTEGKNNFPQDFNNNRELLENFLKIYEPYRFDEAFALIGNYLKKYGIHQVNRKLKKKYDVDLNTFQNIDTTIVEGEMSDSEFNLRVVQFVTKHEKSKNIERAVTAMTSYKNKQGLTALNTKLFMKYGETLNSLEEEEKEEEGMISMNDMHKIEISEDMKEKLKLFYAKYDPTVLGSRGIDRIITWTETNGPEALDQQLKAKYQESLSDFINEYKFLSQELRNFYQEHDNTKTEEDIQKLVSWGMVNGREALNYNLRKRYDADLTLTGGSPKEQKYLTSNLETTESDI